MHVVSSCRSAEEACTQQQVVSVHSSSTGTAAFLNAQCNAGECHGEETRNILRNALNEKLLPKLKVVRRAICSALSGQHAEISMMGSTISSSADEAARVRRSCLSATVQTLPALRLNMESIVELFQDTMELLTAMQGLLSLVCPEKKATKCAAAAIHKYVYLVQYMQCSAATLTAGHLLTALRLLPRRHHLPTMCNW